MELLCAFGKWPQEHDYSHASNPDITKLEPDCMVLPVPPEDRLAKSTCGKLAKITKDRPQEKLVKLQLHSTKND